MRHASFIPTQTMEIYEDAEKDQLQVTRALIKMRHRLAQVVRHMQKAQLKNNVCASERELGLNDRTESDTNVFPQTRTNN